MSIRIIKSTPDGLFRITVEHPTPPIGFDIAVILREVEAVKAIYRTLIDVSDQIGASSVAVVNARQR